MFQFYSYRWVVKRCDMYVADRVAECPDDVQGIGQSGITRRGSARGRGGVEIHRTGRERRQTRRPQRT